MNSFEELGLSPEILSAIKVLGFEKPFPIQEAIIPLLWNGHDVVGQAHTGTGKTAPFGLPILEIVNERAAYAPQSGIQPAPFPHCSSAVAGQSH